LKKGFWTPKNFCLNKRFSGVQGAVFQKSPLVAEGKRYLTTDLLLYQNIPGIARAYLQWLWGSRRRDNTGANSLTLRAEFIILMFEHNFLSRWERTSGPTPKST